MSIFQQIIPKILRAYPVVFSSFWPEAFIAFLTTQENIKAFLMNRPQSGVSIFWQTVALRGRAVEGGDPVGGGEEVVDP